MSSDERFGEAPEPEKKASELEVAVVELQTPARVWAWGQAKPEMVILGVVEIVRLGAERSEPLTFWFRIVVHGPS
jgi:hypothetical protein